MTLAVSYKACATCKTEQPRTNFYSDRSRADGLEACCKSCRKAARARLRAANLEAARRRGREDARKHRAKYLAELQEKARERYALDPEKHRQRLRDWRAAHPERLKEIDAKAAKKWLANHRDVANEITRRRRARLREASIGPVDVAELWELQGGLCALCGDQIDPNLRGPNPFSKSLDHIFPLSRGGGHEQANLQWTHLVCNIRKGAKLLDEQEAS